MTLPRKQRLSPLQRQGRNPKARHFSPEDIDAIASRILSTDGSYERLVVLDLLFRYVALTEETLFRLTYEQVAISANRHAFTSQISRYRKDGLIADVSPDAMRQVIEAGLPVPKSGSLRAYRLGPVGEEYARRKGWPGDAPLPAVNEKRIAHDILCAEAMLHMQTLWPKHPESPGNVEVYGPRQAWAWDSEKQAFLVAPDGLIVKYDLEGNFRRAYLIEHHNVDWALNVRQKVEKYEEIGKPEYRWLWRGKWGVEEMPIVVGLYRHSSIPEYYREELSKRKGQTWCIYAAQSLDEIWASKLHLTRVRPEPIAEG
ncbi:MAG: hypothetical protein ACOYYS_11345 [Chloroflexota bacterium]